MRNVEDARYLDVEAAASVLGMTASAVRNRIQRRQLPFRKLGERIVVPREELDKYIRSLAGVSAAEAIRNLSGTAR
jgi:excisionase family DNA binding protein